MGLAMDQHAQSRHVNLFGRTVTIVQGAGGGPVGDTMCGRLGWGTAWFLGLPFASPVWLSYYPVGPDWVNPSSEWIDRADSCYAVTRFDVSKDEAKVRTWTIDGCTGHAFLADQVTYYHAKPKRATKNAPAAKAKAGTPRTGYSFERK